MRVSKILLEVHMRCSVRHYIAVYFEWARSVQHVEVDRHIAKSNYACKSHYPYTVVTICILNQLTTPSNPQPQGPSATNSRYSNQP